MDRLKILTVFGTRPEAIKLSPVISSLAQQPQVDSIVCVTGQHREMLHQVLRLFNITPDHNLKLMIEEQSLSALTARSIHKLDSVITDVIPDRVIVQGDTTTAMTAALAAFYHKIPVAHVEAGLRTGNIYSPWPEEINRQIVSRIADIHFSPTERAAQNLIAESVRPETIHVTGNTVIDALLSIRQKIDSDAYLKEKINKDFSFLGDETATILVTGHRRENFGPGFEHICYALRDIAETLPVKIVYPVHLNPNVQKPVRNILGNCPNVYLIDPLPYVEFVHLMSRCVMVLTDSGGVQEEAPAFGKPVVVLRENTERPEAVEAGTAILVGTDRSTIREIVTKLFRDKSFYNGMAYSHNPFGDGQSASRIVDILFRIHNNE